MALLFFVSVTIIEAAIARVAEPTAPSTLVYVLAAALGGGAITGVVAWRRLGKLGKVEKDELVTRAAEQAVSAMQQSLMRLEVELQRAKEERDKIEVRLTEAVRDRAILEEKVRILTLRIEELSLKVSRYKTLLDKSGIIDTGV